MRGSRFLGVLAGVGTTVLAAGCGTQHAQAGNQPVDLTAAVSHTRGQTARIMSTIATRSQGMTVSFAEACSTSPDRAARSPCGVPSA